jgi:D-alanyl-D-alanine carboxypeptidase
MSEQRRDGGKVRAMILRWRLLVGAAMLCGVCTALIGLGVGSKFDAHAAATSVSPEVEKKLLADVDKELKTFGGNQSVPGAVVGVWMPGATPWVRAIGLSNLSPREAMKLDDKFRVGSNTKTFVVTVLLQLVDEGKLSLDDPLSKFDVGVKVPNAEHITVRELCQMRSGLLDAYHAPELDSMDINAHTKITPRELVAIAVKHPALFAPGTQYNYSNTNYLLLGLIIETVTHNTAQHEIEKRLLGPLNLKNTSFPVDETGMPAPFSHGFALGKEKNWDDVTVTLPPMLTWTAGVMISDMADMKIWVKDYVSGKNNSAATQKERLDCIPTGTAGLGFGLGIGCTGGWYGYTGGIPGYNTAAFYLPAKDATIIAFVNSQQETPAPGVANAIVRDFTAALFPENAAFSGK